MAVTDDPQGFAQEVVSLYGDTQRCKRICEETQNYIRKYHSIDAAWSVVGEDF